MTSDQTATEEQHAAFAQVGSTYYPIFVAVFTALVIISNVTATKGVAFGPIIGNWSIITDGGFIVFPLTYVIGDVLSEVYGFKAARRAIYLGFAMNILAALTFWVTIYLPPADFYTNEAHFENIVHAYTQLIIAGLAGFIVGQTINAWVVVAIKERTKEKHLWARLVGSTFAGQLGDTLVFCASRQVPSVSTLFTTSPSTPPSGGSTRQPSRWSCCRSPIASSRTSSVANPPTATV